jgi:hypothetical protein
LASFLMAFENKDGNLSTESAASVTQTLNLFLDKFISLSELIIK